MAIDPVRNPRNLTLLDQPRACIPILTTKITIPPARPDMVARPRLINMLEAGWHSHLTLISAPPGSGKTSVVIEWCHAVPTLTGRVAWISLDPSDNDPARFLSYLIAALQTVESDIGTAVDSVVRTGQTADTDSVLTMVINALGPLAERLVIVLDDYHVIDNPDVHELVVFLISHLPAYVRLVLTSRADPPLPLPRLRSRREMTEITEDDLRFTPEETGAFLNEVMDIQLEDEQLERIQQRTEGWIAGLVLAVLSVQTADGNIAIIDEISEISGDHHFIFDYLAQEVLGRQDPQTRDFLLRTSIVERLSSELCDALLDQESSRVMLADLAGRNLFTIALDQRRGWYRYHHLFAEFLREQLRQSDPEEWKLLHGRASAWYEQAGFIEEAVNHALRAGDLDHTVRLLEAHGIDLFWAGRAQTLKAWLDILPNEQALTRPVLRLLRACSMIIGLRQEDAELWPDLLADEFVEQLDERLQGLALVMKAGFERILNPDRGRTVELSRRALDLAAEDDMITRAGALYHLGSVSRARGDFREAIDTLSRVTDLTERSQANGLRLAAESKLATAYLGLGQLRRAHDIARLALGYEAENYTWNRGFLPESLYCLFDVLYEWNELDEAGHYIQAYFEVVEDVGNANDLRHMPVGYIALARAKFAQGDADGAMDTLNDILRRSEELDVPEWRVRQLHAVQAELQLRQGRVEEAAAWAAGRQVGENETLHYHSIDELLTLARVHRASGDAAAAESLIQQVRAILQVEQPIREMIKAGLLDARIQSDNGDEDGALRLLASAIQLGEADGYLRTFIDEGEPVADLLALLATRLRDGSWNGAPVDLEYVERMLDGFDGRSEPEDGSGKTLPQQDLIEPLSEREIEVILLIADGKTNAEIADELFLAVGTVKRHTHNIYGKLGARHRTEAVALAQAAGVLDG